MIYKISYFYLILFFLFASSAKSQSKIFREKWYNYYERALDYIENENWSNAQKDLQKAINKKNEERRNALTYGMRFIDYFPHRELGIVYYFSQQYIDAKKELEYSLDKIFTSKAEFYLKLVEKEIAKLSAQDISPPTIYLDKDIFYTNKDFFEVYFLVSDDLGIEKILINDEIIFFSFDKTCEINRPLFLKRGENIFQIKAVDISGKIDKKEVKIYMDDIPPEVKILPLDDDLGFVSDQASLFFDLSDNYGLNEFVFNGRSITLRKTIREIIKIPIQLNPGKNKFQFFAKDISNNLASGEFILHQNDKLISEELPQIFVTFDESNLDNYTLAYHVERALLHNPKCKLVHKPEQLIFDENKILLSGLTINEAILPQDYIGTYNLYLNYNSGSHKTSFTLLDQKNNTIGNYSFALHDPFSYEEISEKINLFLLGKIIIEKKQEVLEKKLEISLLSLKEEFQNVFIPSFPLEFQIKGPAVIDKIQINNNDLNFKKGAVVYINLRVNLSPGENIFNIFVHDKLDNTIEKKINLKYTQSIDDLDEFKSSILVLPFIGNSTDLTIITDKLRFIFLESHRFRVVDRENTESFLEELAFNQTGLISDENAVKAGKMIGAELTLAGKLFRGREGIEIFCKLINTETSEIYGIYDGFTKDYSKENMVYVLKTIVDKIVSAFPRIKGDILKIQKDKYYINFKTQVPLKTNMKLIAYRQGEELFHPITKESLGIENIPLAILNISNLDSKFIIAKPNTIFHEPIEGDKVLLK